MGGSSCIPKLQQLLKDRFPTAELKNSISPEEVAAIGAAKEVSRKLNIRLPFLSCIFVL